jgi:hypothetical protein
MIKLQVAGYCQNCSEFEPRITKDEQDFTSFDMKSLSYVGVRHCDTIITCEHAARCQGIRNYIQREEKKKNDLQGKT